MQENFGERQAMGDHSLKKQIAVIMGSVNLDNQKKILEGLIAAAKETDTNLYVFTNYVGMNEGEESFLNSYRIMDLPDFDKFDGLIMAINTVHLPPAVDSIMKRIKESNIPVISIDREHDDMGCVKISSYNAQFKIVEHMILEHGYRDIHYVTGPLMNHEANLRYQAYQDALEKYHIPFREDHVFYGSFTLQAGIDAANHFTKDSTCPSCIICGNDAMALGVMEVLLEKGYSIPGDVAVTGFDNGEFSELSFPPLTTIDKNQYDVGRKAVYDVLALANGASPKTRVVSCKLKNRGSCGCHKKKRIDVHLLREKYISQQMITERMSDVVRNMMADLSGQNSLDAIFNVIRTYIKQAELSDFYLCLCEKEKVFHMPEKNIGKNIDIMQVNTDFTDKIYVPIAYEDGEFHSYPYFDKGFVLPEECRNRGGGNVYIITPCIFQKCCYGYSVCASAATVVENSLYYSWMLNIGVALENARSRMLLEDAIEKLNSMWSYDMLTKLYNRAGFYYEAKTMLDNMKYHSENAFIVFFDLDGLKIVNDTMGHEAGDLLIQAMADCIRYNLKDNMLAMRYGGDEFVLFGSFVHPDEVKSLVKDIRNSINMLNNSSRYEFKLSTSIGGSAYKASEITDLSVLIDLADQNMYQEKRRKKEQESKDR